MNLAEFMRPCVWFGLAWPGAREATKAAQDRGGVSPVAACGCNYAIRVAKPVFGPLQRAQRGRRHSDDWFVHARAEGSPVQNSYAAQPECIYPGLPFKRCLAWKLHAAESSTIVVYPACLPSIYHEHVWKPRAAAHYQADPVRVSLD
jgi:hypothetical protein